MASIVNNFGYVCLTKKKLWACLCSIFHGKKKKMIYGGDWFLFGPMLTLNFFCSYQFLRYMQFLQFWGKADENHSTVLHWVERKTFDELWKMNALVPFTAKKKKKELFWKLNANENCRAQNKSLCAK